MSSYLSTLSSKAAGDLKAGILGVIIANNNYNQSNGIKTNGYETISTLKEIINLGADRLENLTVSDVYFNSDTHKELKSQAIQYAKDSAKQKVKSYFSGTKKSNVAPAPSVQEVGGKKRRVKTRKHKRSRK